MMYGTSHSLTSAIVMYRRHVKLTIYFQRTFVVDCYIPLSPILIIWHMLSSTL